ncbi:START domain-containing protein [Vibrio algarum]|uniref:START domain-containing protein n=1 Tax=Vibrio algarum TaxID=3020714 RepID=A0ABT4YXJ4_9VIBR|nr:START domain-containing protein [Vibrio sp. KJ40-1]MDB1125698.1 START domain-containing protein [Vibrio sp. KJ40-1]
MNIHAGLIWLTFLYCLPIVSVQAGESWQPVVTESGIQIHKREKHAGLVEIKAQTLTPTSLEACRALLSDAENISTWVSHAKKANILQKFSESEYLVQTIFTTPWPSSNRDMVTHSTFFQPDKNTLVLNVLDANQSYPRQAGLVRITDVEANWTLQKLNNGMVHISYTAYANPNGMLPIWLANKLTISSVLETFRGLKKRLPLYQ